MQTQYELSPSPIISVNKFVYNSSKSSKNIVKGVDSELADHGAERCSNIARGGISRDRLYHQVNDDDDDEDDHVHDDGDDYD